MFRTLAAVSCIALTSGNAFAQEAPPPESNSQDAMFADIIVTATKKGTEERAQDVPIAITAFGSQQLSALNVRDLSDVSSLVPNAVLDTVGTMKGVAAFSIRGNPQQDSIPTVDPTVGTFVDGVYLGVNAGVIFDTFDLAGVEVLRGPQGILFGRNVTGGAVLLSTRRPSKEFYAELNGDINSGLRGTGAEYMVNTVISGPLSERVQFKVAGYYSKDDGWFKNLAHNGENFGKSRTWIGRAALAAQPSDTLDLTLRYEHGDILGDGTVAQSQLARNGTQGTGEGFRSGTFDVAQNNVGKDKSNWDQVTFETNWDVGIGENGKVTNIFGWRRLSQASCFDIDATRFDRANSTQCIQNPVGVAAELDGGAGLRQHQFSNELRYFGRLGGAVDLTTGFYYFFQKIDFAQNDSLFGGAIRQSGGGGQDQNVLGAFVNLDADVTERLKLSLGGRYSHEHKSIEVAKLLSPKPSATIRGYCNFLAGDCPIDFRDKHSWDSIDVKVGAQYEIGAHARIYASWSTATRAGGYNARVNNPADSPGPVDPEHVSSFEVGLKSEPTRRSRFNITGFYSKATDLQRTVIAALVINGVPTTSQTRANTADATIWGIEAEGQLGLTSHFLVSGTFGYTNASYDHVKYDLNMDGVIDQKDLALKIPRTPEFTWSASAVYNVNLGNGTLSNRATYSYLGKQFAADSNLAILPSRKTLDFNIAYQPANKAWEVGIYGRNILNQAQYTSDLQLPAALGTTFTTIKKGRQFGLKASMTFR